MIIKIDTNKCLGCGRCTEICPEVFKLNSTGKAEVISDDKSHQACALKASDECLVEAIYVEE